MNRPPKGDTEQKEPAPDRKDLTQLLERVISPTRAPQADSAKPFIGPGSPSDTAGTMHHSEPAPSAKERVLALAELVPALATNARRAGLGAITAGRWLAEEVIELAPKLSFRDADTLRRQYPELSDIEIAERVISNAKRTTAAIGAAAGGLSAMEFAAPPTLLAAPVQLAAETIAVTAVELRLVAELHEIMGFAAPGGLQDKASAYLMAWVRRRAVSASAEAAGMSTVLSAAAKKELRGHLMRRLGRSTTSLAPFLAGAAAGAEVNRRSTKHLADVLLTELRTMHEDRWFRRLP